MNFWGMSFYNIPDFFSAPSCINYYAESLRTANVTIDVSVRYSCVIFDTIRPTDTPE